MISENAGFLIKLVESKYVDSILNDSIHFTSLTTFVDEEKQNGDIIIGDKNEGIVQHLLNSKEVCVVLKDSVEQKTNQIMRVIPKDNVYLNVGFKDTEASKIGVACFSYLSLKYDFYEYKKDDKFTYFRIRTDVLKQLEKFKFDEEQNKRCSCEIVRFDLSRVVEALNAENSSSYGLVKYYDMKEFDDFMKVANEGANPAFYKRSAYETQREFRIVKHLSSSNRGEEFEIQGISCNAKIISLSELSKSVVFF